MSGTQQGIVKIVSKFGGIQFEGDDTWYNGIKGVCEKVADRKDDFKGKDVTLSLNDKGNYTFIELTKEAAAVPHGNVNATKQDPYHVSETQNNKPKQAAMTKDDYWARREERDIETQRKIQRAGALNTAFNIVALEIPETARQKEGANAETVFNRAKDLAEKQILPWLNK